MNFDRGNLAPWAIICLLLLALFTLFQNPNHRVTAPDISFSQFLNEADNGRVRRRLDFSVPPNAGRAG